VSPLPDIEPQTAAGKVCLHFDGAIDDARPYGGRWRGPIVVVTHHRDDARPAPDVTFNERTLTASVRSRPAAAASPG